LKNRQSKIQQYQLTSRAKAGIASKKLQDEAWEEDHDISKPHRDHHFLLMLATHGRLTINLDFEEIVVTPPALLLIFPGQVHHIIDSKEPKGWVISFDPSLMDKGLRLVMDKGLRGVIRLDEQTAFYRNARTLMDLIEQLQGEGASGYGIKAVHSLLDALLDLFAEKITTQLTFRWQSTIGRAAIIEQSFNQLLEQHYRNWKQPAQYAGELHISVAYLYDTIKGIRGNSVSTLIQQRSVLEAKRLLYFTDLNVKEIAYETGYDDPVYFGKLFKKTTSLTPLQFRQQYRD
jgi:AraC family transcriptional regulator, transcriptional activator of pobA